MSTEIEEFTVTETEMDTSVETQTVILTEWGKMTVDSLDLSTIMVTVTESPPLETVTETVASDQSIAPLTVTTITVKTLVISETETLEGDVESIFATVTKEIEPSSSTLDEPEPEIESSTLKPWMIALIVVAVLLVMALLGFIYYRWKRKQRELYLASLATTDYNLKGYDKFGTSRSYISEGGRSRYNSKGSYVGYI
ncbi:hypothetical protein IW148_000841 [Coemansia sp. RSA 1199]|nr:hypothetical protein IW148_000841 [Coemansia sp. RSA 1199]